MLCKLLLRVIRGNTITQDFRGPLDGTERVAYFMGHPGRKLAEGREPVCATQLFFDLDDLVGLLPELLVAVFQGFRSLLVTDPLLLFALGEKPGQAANDIVQDNFQVLLQGDGRMVLPVEKHMRHIKQRRQDRGQNAAAKSKPEAAENDRHVIEPAIDIVSATFCVVVR